jgi:predicted nuclease of predicted toxin-antitoxin system
LRVLLDACVGGALGTWLREAGHDVVDLAVDGAPGLGDDEILQRAYAERRVLITIDKDFGELIFVRSQRHTGLLRLPSVRSRKRIEILRRVLGLHAEDLEQGSVVTVRGGRIRVTRPSGIAET